MVNGWNEDRFFESVDRSEDRTASLEELPLRNLLYHVCRTIRRFRYEDVLKSNEESTK